jgi:hypothetical protein
MADCHVRCKRTTHTLEGIVMETKDERQAREARHAKKQSKKVNSKYKKGLAPVSKDKNLRNKILTEAYGQKED